MKKQLLALGAAVALSVGAVASGSASPQGSDVTANVGLAIVYFVHPAPGTVVGAGASAYGAHYGMKGLPGTPGKAVRVAARVAFVGARVGVVGGVGGMVIGAMIGAA